MVPSLPFHGRFTYLSGTLGNFPNLLVGAQNRGDAQAKSFRFGEAILDSCSKPGIRFIHPEPSTEEPQCMQAPKLNTY